MAWHARLNLDYARREGCTRLAFRHEGPLRVLQSLYPEGPGICHNVLVHPPGGLVGGDVLDVQAHLAGGAHALLTTPGAARFYRSEGEPAHQAVQLHLAGEARLEWLPSETIAYDGCLAHNRLAFTLEPGAELMAWDVLALGLPRAGRPFTRGRVRQQLTWPGVWQDSGRIDAQDHRLLDSPLGLGGRRALATLVLARGGGLARAERERALELARAAIDAAADTVSAGATSPLGSLVVVRVLAPLVEPAIGLVRQIRAAWRGALWNLPPTVPRIWAT